MTEESRTLLILLLWVVIIPTIFVVILGLGVRWLFKRMEPFLQRHRVWVGVIGGIMLLWLLGIACSIIYPMFF